MEFRAEQLRNLRNAVVFSDAGICAESGIPTFRDALTDPRENFNPDALGTAQALHNDPTQAWGWYKWRRAKVLAHNQTPQGKGASMKSGAIHSDTAASAAGGCS